MFRFGLFELLDVADGLGLPAVLTVEHRLQVLVQVLEHRTMNSAQIKCIYLATPGSCPGPSNDETILLKEKSEHVLEDLAIEH